MGGMGGKGGLGRLEGRGIEGMGGDEGEGRDGREESEYIAVSMQPKYTLKKLSAGGSGYYDTQNQGGGGGGGGFVGGVQGLGGRQSALLGRSNVPFRSGMDTDTLLPSNLTVNSANGLSYDNDTKMVFWTLLQLEILELEEGLQKGLYEHLSVSRVDQHARQVTLEVNKVSRHDIMMELVASHIYLG